MFLKNSMPFFWVSLVLRSIFFLLITSSLTLLFFSETLVSIKLVELLPIRNFLELSFNLPVNFGSQPIVLKWLMQSNVVCLWVLQYERARWQSSFTKADWASARLENVLNSRAISSRIKMKTHTQKKKKYLLFQF